jgi:tetratricopeptide (TPR) repeat protein
MKVENETSKIDLLAVSKLFSEGKPMSEAIGVSQGFKDSLYSIAVVDYEAKRYERALEGLKFLVILDQNNADYWALTGNALKDLGLYLEAITAWNMAMGLDPQFKTAMTIARVAVAVKDKDWAREGLMMSLAHLKNNPKDQEDYRKLLEAYEAF